MGNVMDVGVILEKAADVIRDHDEIMAGYLYGSFAKGGYDERSDVDIGLLLVRDYVPDPLYESRISLEFDKCIGGGVEARVLNGRDIIFLHQVLRYGRLIFSRAERERIEFESYVYSRYLDFIPFFREYNRVRAGRLLQ
ncbi:MAG: nucleotidyltransferase domain-containing protein [Candidatus Altiarchaeota archaeon]|nr:nucleotidyltransferase domain-containing protein [Candidatus Altiarchaeota archaeon]